MRGGGAGPTRNARLQERRLHAEHVVSLERQIDTRATVKIELALRGRLRYWEESWIRPTMAVGSVPYFALSCLRRSASSRCSGVTG